MSLEKKTPEELEKLAQKYENSLPPKVRKQLPDFLHQEIAPKREDNFSQLLKVQITLLKLLIIAFQIEKTRDRIAQIDDYLFEDGPYGPEGSKVDDVNRKKNFYYSLQKRNRLARIAKVPALLIFEPYLCENSAKARSVLLPQFREIITKSGFLILT